MYKFFKLDSLLENLTGYIEARVELLKLTLWEKAEQSADKAAFAGGSAIFFAVLAFLGFFFLLAFTIALGATLNHVLNSTFWGYWIVAGLYLLPMVILLLKKEKTLFRPQIQSALEKAIADARSKSNQNGQATKFEIENGIVKPKEAVIDHEHNT